MGLVLACGVLGFLVALGGVFVGLPPWAALGIWVGSGPAAALVAIALVQCRTCVTSGPERATALSADA